MKPTQFALAAALLAAGAAHAADTIRIGSLLPLTGGSANMGSAVRDGQRLAVKQINARGGVLGRRLELVELDDEAKPEKAAQNMQALPSKGIVACSCGVNTGVVASYQRNLQAARIPNMIPASAGTKLTKTYANAPAGNYTFRVQASDTLQAQMMVDYAVKKGWRKIALLSDSTPYGVGGHDDMVKRLLAHKLAAVSDTIFNLKDTDMTAQLLRAKEAGANVLLVYGIGPEQGQIAAGAAKLGMKVPLIGSWPNAMDSFLSIAGPAGNGAFSPQTFVEGAASEAGRAFEAAYRAEYKRARIVNPTAAAGGNDSILLLAAAIGQAGSTDGAKIKAALENLAAPVRGAIGTYQKPFSAQDHEAVELGMAMIATWKQGAIVPAPK
ncbi:ABC transporter substrate-binding protein [Massilia glaciei]|uniref:Amino acid ABC transporter substrate-binding protein n=1 Tax=Massilia glaciei TaxID=1524097 RepID=A0A2U2HLQ8_9BURK|nr:ABC transporter substrate-binding protein [Massilia glaciei]PWF48458.1 amino acid ABC transporter substrate-binding protein [Massilia glaciei]